MEKIKPTTRYGQPQELKQWIQKERNSKLANRLNAIRLRQLNYGTQHVAEICGVTTRTVQNWVKQWNQDGKDGLLSKSGGSSSKVTPTIRADIQEVVEVQQQINGKKVTGKLICGYLKKSTK
jgi:transposase